MIKKKEETYSYKVYKVIIFFLILSRKLNVRVSSSFIYNTASSFPNPKYPYHFLSGLINHFKTCVEIEIPSVISSLLCMNDNFLLRYRGEGEERCPPPTKSKKKGEVRPGLHMFSANSKLELSL